MDVIEVNMRRTEAEKSVEQMYLREMSREEVVLKMTELLGEQRYFPLRKKWYEAVVVGINAVKRSAEFEEIRDEVCENYCKWREWALCNHKDPDDAERWLDRNYCEKCPLMRL